jgi:hypothetical protein
MVPLAAMTTTTIPTPSLRTSSSSGAFFFMVMEWQWLQQDGIKGARTGAVDAIVQPWWGGEAK